jgi:hypothetical protein
VGGAATLLLHVMLNPLTGTAVAAFCLTPQSPTVHSDQAVGQRSSCVIVWLQVTRGGHW